MRLKQIWVAFPLPAKVKLFWERITFSRITTFYFIFSVLHCLVQVVFQVQAFTINAQAADFLWHLITQADAKDPGFAVMADDELRFCESVPNDFSTTSCQLIWTADIPKNSSSVIAEGSSSVAPASSTEVIFVVETVTTSVPASSVSLTTPTISSIPKIVAGNEVDDDEDSDGEDSADADDDENELFEIKEIEKRDHTGFFSIATVQVNGTANVTIDGFGFNDTSVSLSRRCLYTLNWPVETLDNTKREDIAFIAFQFWVLGMSIVAILNESIPHIIASLLTHILATGWGAFQIVQTNSFKVAFNKVTTQGACGVNLLPTYWHSRANAEIPSLALNIVALLLSAFLSWRLFKLFGWQTFKRVGASRTINRVYKLVLTLSIAIQLSLFFIVVSIAIWIDSLCNGSVGRLSTNPMLFKGTMVAVIILLIPWLTTGWIAVRRELRLPMLVFLILSFGYLTGWGAMFASPTFRWNFKLWRFFSLITSASVVLTLLTLILGIFCRINFGKGLPRYLNAEEPLPDNFESCVPEEVQYDDEEKVEFPSGKAALPTFSAAFAKDTPPSQMKFGPPRLGPRFNNPSIEPFETPTPTERGSESNYQTTYSRDTYSRETVSDNSTVYQTHMARQASVGSQKSFSSFRSDSSAKSNGSSLSMSKRWMIE